MATWCEVKSTQVSHFPRENVDDFDFGVDHTEPRTSKVVVYEYKGGGSRWILEGWECVSEVGTNPEVAGSMQGRSCRGKSVR